MGAITGDKLRGHLETLILSTLERGEAHGLEILRRLEETGCGLLRLKEGSLYPALYRLEAAGEVVAAWEAEPHGRRGARRRIYHLTVKGRRKLNEGRVEWQSFVRILGDILGSASMNDSTLTHLKVIIERAIRPVRASLSCKRKMREELLAHVSAVFEEERTRLGGERAALEQAAQRFGNPTELTNQLQESVPASDFLVRLLEGLFLRHGGSTLRCAVRYASITFLGCAVFLLPAFFLQERMHEWPILVAIPFVVFCFSFLADWMRQALNGPRGRSWPRAILVAIASWFLVPGATFGVLLTYSGDVRSSLMNLLPLLPGAVLTPVFFVVPLYGFAAEIRSHQEWASLQIN